jgi:PQQ-dependent catabolism-associated CXXCW motif protein
MSHYRAPTPASVPGARTLSTQALLALIEEKAPVLIDVQAVTVRPEVEKELGISWLPNKTRYHIPNSTWLPNVGYGDLEPNMDRYFRSQLNKLTGGDLNQAIVVYCIVDCWMSWNAVQRAGRYGYTDVYWYPEGSDGWAQHGLPLTEATPIPLSNIETEAP